MSVSTGPDSEDLRAGYARAGGIAGTPTNAYDILMGMSAKSRRARTKPVRQAAGGALAHGRLRLPGLREVYHAVIGSCTELLSITDALDAELWLAANICAIRTSAPDEQVYRLAMLDVIDEAERDGRRQCLLLLRAIAAAGPQGLDVPATQAAERLARRARRDETAIGLPGWVDTLGAATPVGDCHLWTNVYGEYHQVYCEYATDGGRRHSLLVTIDLAFRGVVHAIHVVTAPRDLDRVVADLYRDARRDGGHVEQIPPAAAAELIRTALAASADPDLPVLRTDKRDESLYPFLPMAIRRVATMPTGRPVESTGNQTALEWPPQRRRSLVEQFLAAHRDAWDDPTLAGMFAERIVDASVTALGFPPDRIGLASVARLFGEVLPATVMIPHSRLDLAQAVASAWVRWRANAQDLPRAAHRQLRRAADAVLAVFPKLCCDRRFNPTAPYFADAPAAAVHGPTMQQILHRRTFAVPLPGSRGDGVVDLPEPANGLPAGHTHVDDLDAADPAHRQLINAISQAANGATAHRIFAYTAVVEQLWTDQPPEVWQAAQRLSAAGLPRQRVLEQLASAWQRHDRPTGDEPTPQPTLQPTDGYTIALQALGTSTAPRR
jgi:hypothetical protein